jgi:hypothetical protein
MTMTTLKNVPIGSTLYLSDPEKGMTLLHKVIKMSANEVFGYKGKLKLPSGFSVYVKTAT